MSWPVLLVLVLAVGFGVASLRALALDRADEYHLLHGPNDGCAECEGK
jgi:hypothetical protein